MADAALLFSYSGPLAGGHHVVRFLTGDTFSATPLLGDDEYIYLLTVTPNPVRCAARACRAIAAKLSQEADLTIAGELSVKLSQRGLAFVARAKELDAEVALTGGVPYAGGLSQREKDANTAASDTVHPVWRKERVVWVDEERGC